MRSILPTESKEPHQAFGPFFWLREGPDATTYLSVYSGYLNISHATRSLEILLKEESPEFLLPLFSIVWPISLRGVACFLLTRFSLHNVIRLRDQCDIRVSLWTEVWIGAGESIYPWGTIVKLYCWPYQLKPNCFWLTGVEKKSICQINSYIPGTRGCIHFLKQWNQLWYSRAAIGVITGLNLW